jgi:RNA recognition motif-containing protein
LDESSSSKGFAYVRFTEPSDAVKALEALDGSSFQGRLLHILPAVDRHAKAAEPATGEKRAKGLKETRAQTRKDNSGKNFNWAILYMNVSCMIACHVIITDYLSFRVMRLQTLLRIDWEYLKLISSTPIHPKVGPRQL